MAELTMYPTLVVGLGGSGKLVCKILKKVFSKKFPEEWLNPNTGLPPIVEIMAIETQPDKEKEENELILPDIPIIKAVVPIKDLKIVQREDYLRRNPDIASWLTPPLPVEKIIGGAGQIRQAGRLGYFLNRKNPNDPIDSKLLAAVNKITSVKTINDFARITKGRVKVKNDIMCYLITSTCGGTGSGMLLDIAGFLRKKGVSTRLIAFLPKMFEELIDLTESVWLLYANTYATLKEINHYMNKDGNWNVCYDTSINDCVDINEKPFDLVFLIDKESNRVNLRNRKNVAMLMAEFLFWQITEIESQLLATRSNTAKFIDKRTQTWCSSIGISYIYFPLDEIKKLLINWGIKDIINKHLSEDFDTKKINDEISVVVTSDFNYKNWENQLFEKSEYSTLSAETILKERGNIIKKINAQYNNLQEEFEEDINTLNKNYKNLLDLIKRNLEEILDEKLIKNGLIYYKYFAEEFKNELNNFEQDLDGQLINLNNEIEKLKIEIEKNKSFLEKISRSRKFLKIGWKKRIEPHINNILNLIKIYFNKALENKKHEYSVQMLKELQTLIESEIKDKYDNLKNKLTTILNKKTQEEAGLWDILYFNLPSEMKINSNYDEVEKLYEKYLSDESLKQICREKLRKKLLDWKNKEITEIENEISSELSKELYSKKFDDLTLMDAIKDKRQVFNNIFNDHLSDKSSPFIRHTITREQLVNDDYIIHGFDETTLQQLPEIPPTFNKIRSSLCANQRSIIFIRLQSRFSLEHLGPYGFEDEYSKAYKYQLEMGNKWIHILPEAIGFSDPLGLAIGMEEEDLIRTCQCVGILSTDGAANYYYESYDEKTGKRKKIIIGKGLENTIRKIQDDTNLANSLKNMLTSKFNSENIGWVKKYLDDHNRDNFLSEDDFIKAHKEKYGDLPPHRIPSYIKDVINKRIEESKT